MVETSQLDAFGLKAQPAVGTKFGHVGKVIYESKVIIDKETLEPVVEVTERDLDHEIQSYKDECGMAFVLKQIAAGRLSVNAIADDGQHGADLTGMPETLNDACQLNIAATEAGIKAAQEAGLKVFSEEELNAYIQQEIAKAQAAKAAQASAEGGKE